MKQVCVGIIMGSDSDLPVMAQCSQILDEFKIGYEITIVSAHRTPDKMVHYANTAAQRGIKVIVAGAGGAAHLPGMTASMTSLPVIGVPILTKALMGVDSLYSILQMPPGIPVATVAINGGQNAGLLAARMLGVADPAIMEKVVAYQNNLKQMVIEKADKLERLGTQQYLDQL